MFAIFGAFAVIARPGMASTSHASVIGQSSKTARVTAGIFSRALSENEKSPLPKGSGLCEAYGKPGSTSGDAGDGAGLH